MIGLIRNYYLLSFSVRSFVQLMNAQLFCFMILIVIQFTLRSAGTVPVYFGASDVHKFLPDPRSIIFINDFKGQYDGLVAQLQQVVPVCRQQRCERV